MEAILALVIFGGVLWLIWCLFAVVGDMAENVGRIVSCGR
jgi:hypothetical protein